MKSARLDAHAPVCAECAASGAKYTVTLASHTVVEPSAEAERKWDHTGKHHHHSHGYDGATFACSNGHTWQDDLFDLCPASGCKWATHDHAPRMKALEKLAKERAKAT